MRRRLHLFLSKIPRTVASDKIFIWCWNEFNNTEWYLASAWICLMCNQSQKYSPELFRAQNRLLGNLGWNAMKINSERAFSWPGWIIYQNTDKVIFVCFAFKQHSTSAMNLQNTLDRNAALILSNNYDNNRYSQNIHIFALLEYCFLLWINFFFFTQLNFVCGTFDEKLFTKKMATI